MRARCAREPLDLRVRLLRPSSRERLPARAAARDGRGRCVKMSQPACSSASSAASPPRAKSADRPADAAADPLAAASRPPRAGPRARSASNAQQLAQLAGSAGRARSRRSAGGPRPAGRSRPSARSRGTSWRKLTSWSPVQTSSRGGHELAARPSSREQAEHEPPDRVGRVDAVLLQVVPGLVLGDALVHPVRLDQPQERLARQRRTRGSSAASSRITGQDGLARRSRRRPPARARRAREPVALGLVAEDVDEPREAVDGAQVRPQRPREEQRGDREVLGPRAGGDRARGGGVHASTMARGGSPRQTRASLAAETQVLAGGPSCSPARSATPA